MAQLYNLLYIVRYTPLILTLVTGSFADKIGPKDEDANIVEKETDTVTLKCSYDTSSNYILLYWYKQYPNSAPQFLLYKGARSEGAERTPSDTRLKSETSRDSTELSIRGLKLSDSALYLCALRDITQVFQFTSLLNSHFSLKVVDEGEDVTLSCKYTPSFSSGNNFLQWYRQYPKSKPEFLLQIVDTGAQSPNTPPRMSAEVNRDDKQVDLIISSAAVSDSALYYCALVPTVTGNTAALYKN
ncbi:uncharacterized protein LOC113636507 [Tachysurus fulvidraco]|uniref:uncharacterized protein LOC113636507 n=1 Tax=Tachysurus fulvidraco TaxID=1234273 RepID=UPI001FED7D38|nr:uncharacterized protein LOC113636507 [Tachysurus fulvidraco]